MNDSNEQDEQPLMPKLKKLLPHQIQEIDEYLTSIEDYGEVRLIVQKGQLRYINNVVSYSVAAEKPKKMRMGNRHP